MESMEGRSSEGPRASGEAGRYDEQAAAVVGHAAFSFALSNWKDTAHVIPSRTWIRALTTPVPNSGITSPRSLKNPRRQTLAPS